MAGEKFVVTLAAKIKTFMANMKKATKAMKSMGMQNRGIIKGMQKMSSAAIKSGKAVQKSTKKTKDGLDKMGRSADKAGKKGSKFFKIFASGAVALGAAASAMFLFRKALQEANLAAQMDVQAKAFANLVQSYGASSKKLLVDLQAASKETLSLQEIMITGSRAILLGIQQNKLVDLMKIARAASKAMGTTITQAFSDISLGIGRQSRLILDNLGIIVRVGVAYDRYAASVGTTADALTDFEKKQAFQNAVIEAGQDIIERSSTGIIDFQDRVARANTFLADTWAKLRSAFLGFFLTLAEFLSEGGFIDDFQKSMLALVNSEVPTYLASLSKHFDTIATTLENIKKKGLIRWFGGAVLSSLKADLPESMGGQSRTSGPQKERSKARTTSGKLLDAEILEGERKSKELEKKTTDWGARLKKNLADALKVASGGADPTKSDLFIAERGVKALDEALKDVNVSAQDLQKQFAQTMPVIKRGFESLGPPTNAQVATLNRLAAAQQDVADSAFVEGLGLETDKLFKRNASRDIAKVERLLKIGKISDPKALIEATDALLKKVRSNVEWLTGEQRKKLKALNIQLSKIIPADRIRDGLNQWVDDFNSTTDRMRKLGVALAENLATAWGDFFFDSITGKITSLEDAFKSMTMSMLRSLSQFLGKKATQEFLGLAFGATGTTTQSGIGAASLLGGTGGLAGLLSGPIKKAGGFVRGLFGGGGGGAAPTSVFSGGGGGASSLGGFGGILSGLGSGIGGLLGFADGGIADFAGAGTGIHSNPTLAAIAEKPGKKEAVMPLEKFTDLVQPVNINISTIDTKSFQQYMMENKEIVLGTIMGIKGSRTVDGMHKQKRGPF